MSHSPDTTRYSPHEYEPRSSDDLIDFPTSDTFRDFYFERGMTSRPSPSYWAREVALRNKQEEVISDLQDNGLAKTMDKLASAIAQVAEEVKGANITLHFGAKIGERKQKGPVEEGGVSETSNPKRQRKD